MSTDFVTFIFADKQFTVQRASIYTSIELKYLMGETMKIEKCNIIKDSKFPDA